MSKKKQTLYEIFGGGDNFLDYQKNPGDIKRLGLGEIDQSTYTGAVSNSSIFQTLISGSAKSRNTLSQVGKLYGTITAMTPEEKVKLAEQNPALMIYNEESNKFSGPLGSDYNKFQGMLKRRTKAFETAAVTLGSRVESKSLYSAVPNIVKSIVDDNKDFSNYGLGKVSGKTFPLYAGRWIDPVTGKVKMLPKASAKYLNPASYSQTKMFHEAKVLNKWNEFVGEVETLAKFMTKDATEYENAFKERISKRFEKESEVISKPTRVLNDYKKYILNYPMGPGEKAFWKFATASADFNKLLELMKQSIILSSMRDVGDEEKKLQSANSMDIIKSVTAIFSSMMASPSFKSENNLKVQTAATNYGYSLVSGRLKAVTNTLMTITKMVNIPANLTDVDATKVEKMIDEAKDQINTYITNKGVIPTRDEFKKIGLAIGAGDFDLKRSFKDVAGITRSYMNQPIQPVKRIKPNESWSGLSGVSGLDLTKALPRYAIDGEEYEALATLALAPNVRVLGEAKVRKSKNKNQQEEVLEEPEEFEAPVFEKKNKKGAISNASTKIRGGGLVEV